MGQSGRNLQNGFKCGKGAERSQKEVTRYLCEEQYLILLVQGFPNLLENKTNISNLFIN